MIQTALTATFNAVAILAIAYVLLAFSTFIMSRRCKVSPGQLELFDIETKPVGLDMSFDDLLTIGGDRPSLTLQDCTIRQLKAMASLYQVPRFNKLRKESLAPVVLEAIAS